MIKPLHYEDIKQIVAREAVDPSTEVFRLVRLCLYHMIEFSLDAESRATFHTLCHTAKSRQDIYEFVRTKLPGFDQARQELVEEEITKITEQTVRRLRAERIAHQGEL